jgi:hypothetical protein
MEEGYCPMGELDACVKVASPLPRSITTVLLLPLRAAISILPSPLKSPVATKAGAKLVTGVDATEKAFRSPSDGGAAGVGLGEVSGDADRPHGNGRTVEGCRERS